MKPFVIYIEPNKNDKLVLTKEEFEQYIQEAYDRGLADGRCTGNLTTTSPTITPSPLTPATPLNPWYTTTPYCGDMGTPKVVPLKNTESITLHS